MEIQRLLLSNDAFYYLKDNDPPLDDANIEEAERIRALFPDGFRIEDGWEEVAGTGAVAATFAPLPPTVETAPPTVETAPPTVEKYAAYQKLSKGYFLRLQPSRGNRWVKVWRYWESAGKALFWGEFELKRSTVSKTKEIGFATGDWRNGKGCLFWLKDFTVCEGATVEISDDLPEGL